MVHRPVESVAQSAVGFYASILGSPVNSRVNYRLIEKCLFSSRAIQIAMGWTLSQSSSQHGYATQTSIQLTLRWMGACGKTDLARASVVNSKTRVSTENYFGIEPKRKPLQIGGGKVYNAKQTTTADRAIANTGRGDLGITNKNTQPAFTANRKVGGSSIQASQREGTTGLACLHRLYLNRARRSHTHPTLL